MTSPPPGSDSARPSPDLSPGQGLSGRFYRHCVRPALDRRFPGLPHAAALLGRGSEVLGFDDSMSTDHDWSARLVIFLSKDDHARHAPMVETCLRQDLPTTFEKAPTDLSLVTVRGYLHDHLDLDVDLGPAGTISAQDWLTLPEQRLIMITGGPVFHDDVGLREARDRLAYYPHDVWLLLLAAGWWRIHPEMNLVGRSGWVGDELGSTVIAARLVQDMMRLVFVMERRYAPYPKWFGTAFARLDSSATLIPLLTEVVRAPTWATRESALAACYHELAAQHDALGITDSVPIEPLRMWNRPFAVPWGDVPGALHAQISDPEVRALAARWPVGGVDQIREVLFAPRDRQLVRRLLD